MITQLSGTHDFPVFKTAANYAGRSATGISAFAGEAHLHASFMETASKCWRKAAPMLKTTYGGKMSPDLLKKSFRFFDKDHSGELTEHEVRKVIKLMAPQLTDIDVKLMMACADTDADGSITEAEFVKMMLHNHEKDVDHWEKYGKRDMMYSLADRKDQIRY